MNKRLLSRSGVGVVLSLLEAFVLCCAAWLVGVLTAVLPVANAQESPVCCWTETNSDGETVTVCVPCWTWGLGGIFGPSGGPGPNPEMPRPDWLKFPEYRRGESLQGRLTGLQANSTARVVLLHEQPSGDPTKVQMLPFGWDEGQVGADGILAFDVLKFRAIPPNASGGRYLVVAYPSGSSLQETLMNLRPQQVQSFQLSPRISALEARPFEKSWGGKFDSIQTKWGYDAQPGDRLQVQWYRDGQKYGDLHSVETLPQNVSPQLPRSSAALRSSPSRLLPSSNIFDALDDDRQGMGFYAPQMGAFTAFPGLKKVFPELETPPLESGTYKVEIYLNGTLEGTKEVVLP